MKNITSDLSGKSILAYTFLPQVGPRIRSLIGSGFSNLAFFMLLVYQAVKLIPDNHPYLNKNFTGNLSVRDVLKEASNNLKFDSRHIDQVIIFFALIAGIIILVIQFGLLLMAILIRPASAQAQMPAGYGSFFTTPNPTEDLAFRLLDRVFGVPDLFGSKEVTETAFHQALHGLLQFYSIGLLIIGAMLLIYLIFVVVAETAQTGTPFGKRYNHTWVPIRLVVAFGLLIPVSYGLNSAQWITLSAAKMGSGFATNGWNTFNEALLGDDPLTQDKLIAEPNIPSLKDISAFMMLAQACRNFYSDIDIRAYLIDPEGMGNSIDLPLLPNDAIRFTDGESFLIRFGEKGDEHTKYSGKVFPYCGEIVVPNSELPPNLVNGSYRTSPYGVISGRYYVMAYDMWEGSVSEYQVMLENAEHIVEKHTGNTTTSAAPLTNSLKETVQNKAKIHMQAGLEIALNDLDTEITESSTYQDYGWAGAGIWYNQIAGVNGKLTNIVFGKPTIKSYPSVMKFVCEENQQQNENVTVDNCYDPQLSQGKPIKFSEKKDATAANIYKEIHEYWYATPDDGESGNAIINIINAMFGTQGLFDMCRNANVHPLAQLATTGKGLVEAAIRNIGIGLGLGIASIIPVVGPSASALSGMAMTFASIGILIGFMLYYIVPFMPFLYFLFAVGGWVKGLFEAMVGVPLWALAHIRIDGQGLPGDGAINGYFLIFEIFIRPILIVFGLIAAVVIFGAMIKVLNDIFSIVVNNLAGNDPSLGEVCFQGGNGPTGVDEAAARADMAENFRGPIDEFFYTIIYAILVYMIGMASFKLIDLIPNNILRWMGQGVQTFSDNAGEPAEGLMQKMAVGGALLGSQVQQVGGALGQSVSKFGKAAKDIVIPKE